jgi:hypothetical protein
MLIRSSIERFPFQGMTRRSEAKSPLRVIRGFRRILVTAHVERRPVTILETKCQME